MKRNYIQPAMQVTQMRALSVLMGSGEGIKFHGKVGSIKSNTPLFWATANAGPGADACSGV